MLSHLRYQRVLLIMLYEHDFNFFNLDGITEVACSGKVSYVFPLSSSTPTQSPAHSFVPRIVPTSLQPDGSFGFT